MAGIDRMVRKDDGIACTDASPLPVKIAGGTISIDTVNMEATATAADPIYAEAAIEPISMDRSGNQRTRMRALAQAVATAAAEGAIADLSLDLARRLRMHDNVLGELADGAWSGAGDATIAAILRAVYGRQRNPSSTFINRSGAITTANASQQAMALNTARQYLLVQNPMDATTELFVEIGAAASSSAKTSVELTPGGHMEYAAPGYVPTGAVNVTSTIAGAKFIAKEG